MVLGSGILQRSSEVDRTPADLPRFTIVIPNYNGGPTLERAIRSALDQNYANLQLILADAESDDASRAVIQRYVRNFSPLIRRRDEGQADGLNFAFRNSTGDIHGWLCSDDELLPGSLDHVAQLFTAHPEIDIVAGATERVFEGHFRNYVPVPVDAWDQIGAQNVFDQPAVFWRSSVHKKVGELDTSFQLAFDWDFWCRMRKAGARLKITDRALARYYFSGFNKSSVAGHDHVEEGFRIIRRYGPFHGRLAHVYRFLYRHFDLKGAMDEKPTASPARRRIYTALRATFDRYPGRKWMDLYNWHFASLQERNLEWWDYKRATLAELKARLPVADIDNLKSDWTGGTSYSPEDHAQPSAAGGINVVLNRKRLAAFSEEFASDADVRDLVLLDALSAYAGLGLTSGPGELPGGLAMRPFRRWEYVWLFKALGLRGGGLRVLDAGGPLSHLTFLAAFAGNDVISVDSETRSIDIARKAAAALGLDNLRVEKSDIRDLNEFPENHFDVVIGCSVLEHMASADQSVTIARMARVLKPGGRIGLTFDYGPPAASASIFLPPPHEPPKNAAEVRTRFVRAGLQIAGGEELEDPVPGSLFAGDNARYTVGSLFLSKGSPHAFPAIRPIEAASLLGARTIPDPAGVAHASVSTTALRREREEAEKQTWVNQFNSLNQRIAILEEASQQRLVILERSHGEAERMREELENISHEAARRLALINELTEAVKDRDALRTEAEKRLELINSLTREIAARDQQIATLKSHSKPL